MSELANDRLEELAASAESADTGASFMSPENSPAPKKGRGRPKGSKNKKDTDTTDKGPEVLPPENQSAEQQIEANKLYLKPVFEMLSTAGVMLAETEKAAIGPTEMVVMVDAAARCVHQYLPSVIGAHTNLVVFSMAFCSWGFRVYALREETLAELRRKKAAMKENPTASPVQENTPPMPPVGLM